MRTDVVAALWAALSLLHCSAAATAPTTGPATSSAPASAPAPKLVHWQSRFDPAAAEAKKRRVPLLVIYGDPDHPASQAFDQMTLSDAATREFLSEVAAVRLDATRGEGKARFAKTGAKEAPLTQIFSPDGQLLDSRRGCIIPASRFRQRVSRSQAYWRAATTKPFDAAARWRAVEARLKLSTRAAAAGDIDALLKLPAGQRPRDVTPAALHLARGKALMYASAKQAEQSLRKAHELAPKDADVGGQAMLLLAEALFRAGRAEEAHGFCTRYIKAFPASEAVGSAYLTKARLEFLGLGKPAQARATLEAFLDQRSDDPLAVAARRLLDDVKRAIRKGKGS